MSLNHQLSTPNWREAVVVHKRDAMRQWGAPFSFNAGTISAPLLTWRNVTNQLGINNAGVDESGAYVDLGTQAEAWQISTLSRAGGSNGNGGALLMRSVVGGKVLQTTGTQSYGSFRPLGLLGGSLL